jgi:hypothetical protein
VRRYPGPPWSLSVDRREGRHGVPVHIGDGHYRRD